MELSEAELLAIVDDLKIEPTDIKLRTDAKLLEMRQLPEPLEASVQELQAKKAAASSLEKSHIVKSLEKEVFALFPAYKDREMHKCNYAEQKRSISLDAGLLCEKLLEALEK